MPTITPEIFKQEAERRLIGVHDLMIELGLRGRSSVWRRVRSGALPEPVFSHPRAGALWDRDDLPKP